MLVQLLIVPVLQYNGFHDSTIIGLGWTLVRDVVNMFVVIILIVIALFTALNLKQANWQQNLPQLLLAVILVNFSRTICGFLIDISQIIMSTFVNALLEVAAGNLTHLLGLTDFGAYATAALQDPDGTPIALTTANSLGAAYLLFCLYAAIFAIMLLLALVFIYRIVLLWVLVILSPLAFFLGGIKGVIGSAAGNNAQWWSQFTGALTLGPMLTFFLWLALATSAGSGNAGIADVEGFPTPDQPMAVTLASLQTDQLVSTFVGLILLVVGMQQSSKSAGDMGGFAKSLINEKMGTKIVQGIATRNPLAAAGRAAGYTAGRSLATTGTKLTGGLIAGAGRFGASSALGAAVAPAVIGAAGAAQGRMNAFTKAGSEAAKKRNAAKSDDQKSAELQMIAAGRGIGMGAEGVDDAKALLTDRATNSNMRKIDAQKVKDGLMTAAELEALDRATLKHAEDNKTDMDDGQKAKINKMKSEKAHLLDEDALKEHVQSADFNARDLSKDAIADPRVIKAMQDKYIRTDDKGNRVSAYDELMRGAYSTDLREAARTAQAPDATALAGLRPEVRDAAGTVTEAARPYTPAEIANAIASKKIDINTLTTADFSSPNGSALMTAVIDSGSIGKLSSSLRDDLSAALDTAPAGTISVQTRQSADAQFLESGKSPTDLGIISSAGPGLITREAEVRIEQVINNDISATRHFTGAIPGAGARGNQVTETIVKNIDTNDIKKLSDEARTATDKRLAEIKSSLEAIDRALSAEELKTTPADKYGKEIIEKRRAVKAASRYV